MKMDEYCQDGWKWTGPHPFLHPSAISMPAETSADSCENSSAAVMGFILYPNICYNEIDQIMFQNISSELIHILKNGGSGSQQSLRPRFYKYYTHFTRTSHLGKKKHNIFRSMIKGLMVKLRWQELVVALFFLLLLLQILLQSQK